jgi:acetoin utilization protein AcuC
MSDTYAFLYSHRFAEYSYGEEHPFRVERFRLAYELIAELGLLDRPGLQVCEAPLVSEEDLLSFHRADYLQKLAAFSRQSAACADFRYGLGDNENPVFEGLYDWARLACGATMEAVRQVTDAGCRVAFNMAGGWHHAHAAKASGFSYLNDAVVAILWLLRRGLRVAYVDIDAHHGDGVQEAFYDTDRVLTISLHECGPDFFPYTGFAHELGRGRGYGYAVNIPFAAHADDLIFEQGMRRVVLPLLEAFRPDVLVTQMGVDALRSDPLARLELTTGSLELAARMFRATGFPWVILGGGGYDKFNVARGWALIWASAIGAELPDAIPPGFARTAERLGRPPGSLRDPHRLALPDDYGRAQRSLDRTLAFLERRLSPLHRLSSGGSGWAC